MNARLIAFLFSVVLASTSLASPSDDRIKNLPEHHQKWLEEEVVYIIADVEREAFLSLEAEEERESFIEAFWRKRDNNPSTIENEFREEHYERLAYANEFLGRETFNPGWRTDQGQYFITLGPPRDVQNFEGKSGLYPAELWFYNDAALQQFGLPSFFHLLFFKRNGVGEFTLYSPITDGPESLLSGHTGTAMTDTAAVENAYYKLFEVTPELAKASLSFRTDEGDIVDFRAPAYGTASLLNRIATAPTRGIDTSYAERFDIERGLVESDYLFTYVPSWSDTSLLPGPENTYYLHWVIEIDPQNIAMIQNEGRQYGTVFIISAEVVSRDDPNKIPVDIRKESFMSLSRAQAEPALGLPFAYSGMLPLVPGSYDVRIILRNRACATRDESSCLKSYTLLESSVNVPDWNNVRPQLSDLVLSYGIERPGGQPLDRPYRFGTLQLLPNPRHVYAIGDSAVVMVEPQNVVDPGSTVRFRILNREAPDQVLIDKSVPVDQVRLEPLVQEFSLEDFTSGRYQLAVELLGPDGREVAEKRTSDFDVTPRSVVPRPSLRGSWLQAAPEVPGLVKTAIGEQHMKLGDLAKARELFEAAITANARLAPARESLSVLLLRDGESARVIELLLPMVQDGKPKYEPLALLGEAYFQKKDYAKVAEVLEKALVLRRPSTPILNMLGISLLDTGNTERAQELLEKIPRFGTRTTRSEEAS